MTSRAWSWRHAILDSTLEPTTRHVLLTISCYMNDVGGACYPTIETLVASTGLSERAVFKHIKLAEALGWLSLKKHGFKGQRWANNEYAAKWPDLVEKIAQPAPKPRKSRTKSASTEEAMPVENESEDLFSNAAERGEGPAPRAVPYVEGEDDAPTAENTGKVLHHVQQGPAPKSTKVLHHVHTILPVNPSKILPEARERAGRGESFSKFWNEWPTANRPDNRDHVRKLFEKLTPADQLVAQDCAETYRRVCATRGDLPKMVSFLKDRLFEDFHDAPPIDRDGDFVITPGRPEWQAWLGDVRASFGEPGVQSSIRLGRIVRKDRWPTGHEAGRRAGEVAA
ncbi:hypothetical protein ASG43_03105 [Aureimonas sp. Leaf454]|uniref:helix-turn-helix domain-containing protein n=1 Tax=Aureimonas sp. Leaf454 TaxID=1736381 RepID=UPI0007008764|nr:helix-turn-helix domain-containing protein [Aureimonas sp. Leaf454]KQT54587.1 hypothetical protein ASG43_03105 [Aureimonas sp. Leaf454]